MTDEQTPPVLEWNDARGVSWRLEPHPDVFRMSRAEELISIPRNEWNARINYNVVAGGTVFRFDTGVREVGFLVGSEEARLFLEHLGWSHAEALDSATRVVDAGQSSASWPSVTPAAVAGLLAAALALWPILGYGLAIISIVCTAVALSHGRSDERLRHVRTVAAVTAAVLVVAVVANSLATYLLWAHEAAGRPDQRLRGVPLALTTTGKVLAVLSVLLALCVHECAHAIVAWWCGDTGPLERGRVTLNPLAHIDPVGTILVPAVLAYWGGMVFGWAKPVMTDLHGLPRPRRASLLIAIAGPTSNLLLGMVFLALYVIAGCAVVLWLPQARIAHYSVLYYDVLVQGLACAPLAGLLLTFLKWGFCVNFLLCWFNLIPIPPLDGSHVLESMFPGSVGRFYRKLGGFALLIFLGLIATGVLQVLLLPAERLILMSCAMAGSVTGL